MMRQFHDLKQKHPDAVLLFRCGDFYETYEQDAKVVSEVLCITLTKRAGSPKGEGYMAGFPYHALDTYLPKLIRAGHHVAICDQLEPPKPTKKRGITEMVAPATAETINNDSSTTNNDTTMKLNINTNNTETKNTVNNQTIALQGSEYTVKDNNGKDVKFGSVVPAAISEAPQGQPVSEAKPSTSTGERGESLPQVTFSTYKTKRGDTAPQIIGFTGEDDPRWKAVKESGVKWASASYRKDISGEKVYLLMFGTKYMQAAQQLCDAYNSGDAKQIAEAQAACQAIYEQAQAEGKARWEAKKAEWAAKKKNLTPDPSPKGEGSEEKTYTASEVAELLRRIKEGDAKAMELVNKLMAA